MVVYQCFWGVIMRQISIFLLSCIFSFQQPLEAIIYQATKLTTDTQSVPNQTIWLLGDCHEYLDEIDSNKQALLKELTAQQRTDIIAFAKNIGATVLVEDMVTCQAAYPILGLPTLITLAMDQFLGQYYAQVITNLCSDCAKQKIPYYSIECRHTASILREPPHYLPYIMTALTSWLPAIGKTVISSIYFGTSIGCMFGVKELLAINLPQDGALQKSDLLTLHAHQSLENNYVLTNAKKLHTHPKIQERIKKLEKQYSKKSSSPFDDLVDFKALNYIIEHPETENIIICAGSWHTNNIASLLKLSGYQKDKLESRYTQQEPMIINAEKHLILPIALQTTFAENSIKLA